MFPDKTEERTLKEYRESEVDLHIELMKICRKYMSDLGIISIMGILDIVKQEIVELEKATRKGMKVADFKTEDEAEEPDLEVSDENQFKDF